MRVHGFAAGLVFAALSVAVGARAQPATPAAAVTSSALPLQLDLGSSGLDAEAVRKAIELELKRPVVLTTLAADTRNAPDLSVIAHADHTVTVSYRTNTGTTRSRSMNLPEDRARGAEVIALLSGNLSRDEAAELLADLAAKGAPSAETAPATSDGSETVAQKAAAETDTPARPTAAETLPPPSPPSVQPSAPPPLIKTSPPAINLSVVPSLALYRNSEQRIFSVEFGLAYSHVGELHGAGLNLAVLRTERDVRGASFAAFYNVTGGTVTGASGSALINRRQGLRGLEFGGLLTFGSADGQGVAAAGLANLAQGFEGLQAAGLVNSSKNLRGVQAAGILNRAHASTGLQAAGVLNIADSISGLQVGVVNVASEVHGLQLGVVNVAKQVKGTSIGLVSVADNGRVQPVLWASSSQPINAAAKFTVGPVYTQAGLGYSHGDQTYSYELGLGGHLPIGRFFLELGVHYSEVRSAKHPFDHALVEFGHYRVAAGLDGGRVSPFAGVGILQRFAHSADAPSSTPVTVEVFGGVAFF
ncbi:MAG TPA: hypothetical protein VJV79_28185 [Polyangiaceae bacterium]|nr:hypothetical protein [Polyangiaceae bacterium]